MTNCCLIDFKGMLENGFKIGNAEVESPKSIQTATAQISQIIANVASSQYGGCSADRIDEVFSSLCREELPKAPQRMRKKWVLPDKREDYAWKKTQKISTMPCNLFEYEINTLFHFKWANTFYLTRFWSGNQSF